MRTKDWRKQWLSLELWFVLALITVLLAVFIRSTETLTQNAEMHRADQLRSNFTMALRLLRSSWVVAGRPQQVTDFKEYGAGNLNLNEEGWPVAVTGNSTSSQVTEDGCRELFSGLLQSPLSIDSGGSDGAVGETQTPITRVLAVRTVCVYQFGNSRQDNYSLLYNADSGEVRMAGHLVQH